MDTIKPNPHPQTTAQALTEEATRALNELLNKFPDLRSAVLVLDYELRDRGSLPPGVWIYRRPLSLQEALHACKAVDSISYMMREHHDTAVLKAVQSSTPDTRQEDVDG